MKKSTRRAFAALVLFVLFSTGAAAQNTATLFQNDSPFSDEDAFPLLEENGTLYAPFSFFDGFPAIKLQQTDESVCLSHRENGRFFSYSSSAPDALLTEQNRVSSTRVPKTGNMPYLPLFSTAQAFLLRVEIVKHDPYTYVRLTDGNERLSFHELCPFLPIDKDK